MGQHAENVQQNINEKNQQEKEDQINNAAYYPDQEITLTGEQFFTLIQQAKEARTERVHMVMDRQGEMIGQSISGKDMDIEKLFQNLNSIHREKYENGETVPLEEVQKELKRQEQEKQQSEPQSKNEEDVAKQQDE